MPDSPPILSYARDEPKLVRIGPFRDLLEAEMAAGRLTDEGIHTSLDGANMAATMGPVYGAAYGGLFVLVPADDEASARAIIASIDAARKSRSDLGSPPCPQCGRRPSERVLVTIRWVAFGMFAVALALPFYGRFAVIAVGLVLLLWPMQPRWKCAACKYRFTAPAPTPPPDEEDSAEQ